MTSKDLEGKCDFQEKLGLEVGTWGSSTYHEY